MLILPAIDLIGGKCVRLIQGDYSKETVYSEDPVSVAKGFRDMGATWLHMVDLDGAKAGRPQNLAIIEDVVKKSGLKVELGGGVRTRETTEMLLKGIGVERVVIGTKLVKDPVFAKELFAEFGEGIVAGIDARNGYVAVEGWQQTSSVSAVELSQDMEARGAKRIILTDIARDGMLTGPNLQLLSEVIAAVTIPVIQSGGISTIEDIRALLNLGDKMPEGVITGKAIYEGTLNLIEAISVSKN